MARVRYHRVQVLRRLPHPGRGFTQGLIADGDTVWESTGLYGESALCRYRLGNDKPAERAPLPPDLFGEGICLTGGHIWQLTWQERLALRWDPRMMTYTEIPYNREGWGICAASGADGRRVITSDGSSELVLRDPDTLAPRQVIAVRYHGGQVQGLNDLAWSAGRVWANVAGTSHIVGIDPASGEVTDVVDAKAAAERHVTDPQAIMNGIAALTADDEFLITGKGWHLIRHVRLAPDH